MSSPKVTPLQPREFFRGVWTSEGEIIPHPLFRWFLSRERLRHSSETHWLSGSVWIVKDWFEFSSGRILERKMFAELVGPDRIHVTADDMPLGADILLHEKGFRFSPYYALASYKKWRIRVRCVDECRIDADVLLYDTIEMSFWGIPIATMRLGPIRRGA